MTGQDGTIAAPIGPTITDVVDEIAAAEAALDYRDACVERMRAAIQLGALGARTALLARITREGFDTIVTAPAAAQAMADGLTAADEESRRLLALLGVELPASDLPPEEGDRG